MAESLVQFTDQNWQSAVLSSAQPVLVDFWGEWCAPCKALVPHLEGFAAQYAGRLKIGQLNVAENDDVPVRYNVATLPTLLLFKNGQVAEHLVGQINREKIRKVLESHVG